MHRFFENFYDWWKNIDKFILFLISVLFFLGLFFSLVSTSLIASDKLDTNSYYFFIKHLIFIGLGASILFFLSILKEDILIKISLILFFITLVFLLMVPFVGIEETIKIEPSWLRLKVKCKNNSGHLEIISKGQSQIIGNYLNVGELKKLAKEIKKALIIRERELSLNF